MWIFALGGPSLCHPVLELPRTGTETWESSLWSGDVLLVFNNVFILRPVLFLSWLWVRVLTDFVWHQHVDSKMAGKCEGKRQRKHEPSTIHRLPTRERTPLILGSQHSVWQQFVQKHYHHWQIHPNFIQFQCTLSASWDVLESVSISWTSCFSVTIKKSSYVAMVKTELHCHVQQKKSEIGLMWSLNIGLDMFTLFLQ